MRVYVAAIVAIVMTGLVAGSAGALGIDKEVTLPEGEVGMPYEFVFTADEGCQPYHFHYKVGTVPGLTIAEDGTMSGIPTTAGTFQFWVEVTDGIPGGACTSPMPSQGEYSVVIAPKVEITANLPGAKVGAPFSTTITAAGGGSLEWSIADGSLPPGLTLNRVDGTLSGTPSSIGSYTFTVKVADAKRQATKQYTFVVGAPLAVAPATAPAGEVGVPFTATVPFTGGIGPLRWSATLPAGLTLDGGKGMLGGTPAAAGTSSVPLTIVDSDGQTVHTTLALSIARRLKIAPTKASPATVGKRFRLQLGAIGGVAPRVWTVALGKLPPGLELDRAGLLTGTPSRAGRYSMIVRVADKLGVRNTRRLALTVTAG